MISREQLDKLYNEYLSGVRRESRKGKMQEPMSKSMWASEFQMVVADEYGAGGRSMTELRRVNNMMIRSSKEQLSRKQRNALAQNLAGDWRTAILEDDSLGLSYKDIPEIERILTEIGWRESMSEDDLRRLLNFEGKRFTDLLEGYGFSSWWIFFNS